jgi:two-component system, OmpR family, sensor histidine kinase BaeS
MASARPPAVRSLTARLTLAFVAVALTAIGLLAALTLWSARNSVEELVETQRAQVTVEITAALGEAYQRAGGWAGADLRPAAALAAASRARLQLRDAAGHLVDDPVLAMQQRMGQMHDMAGPGPVFDVPVLVAGQLVGAVELRFPAQAPPAASGVRDALVRTVAVGALLGVGVALAAAIPIARRITRPLAELTTAARGLSRGDLDARVGSAGGFAELAELGATFDRMAAALQHEDELRRALVSDVAHELRTPVTILQASCEELADGLAEPTPERLTSLHQEVLRLGRVVEDVEILAAAEAAGRLRLDLQPVDLAAVTGEVLELLQPRATQARVTLHGELHAATVSGDPHRLHQIATNLVTNAVKFTPPGGAVTVTVDPAGGSVRLVVADTGPGIEPGELPHLYDRFWRGRAATGTPGSGVGLTVVAELVRAHGGRIEVTSTPAIGSAFTVWLPAAA